MALNTYKGQLTTNENKASNTSDHKCFVVSLSVSVPGAFAFRCIATSLSCISLGAILPPRSPAKSLSPFFLLKRLENQAEMSPFFRQGSITFPPHEGRRRRHTAAAPETNNHKVDGLLSRVIYSFFSSCSSRQGISVYMSVRVCVYVCVRGCMCVWRGKDYFSFYLNFL